MNKNINFFEEYKVEYEKSIKNPEDFWADKAEQFTWEKKWEKIFGKKKPEIKARKTQPEHSKTQVHKDKSKQFPRKYKYNHIEDSIST